MDEAHLTTELQTLRELNRALLQSREQLQADHAALRADHETILAALQTVKDERDQLQVRYDKLAVTNQALVDRVWGRKSERSERDPNQPYLAGSESWWLPETTEEAEVVMAADAIQEKSDEEILRRHRERRERRKRERPRTEELPAHLERRERVLDLPDDQKAGLRFLRTEVTERLELDRPQAWVDRIVRYLYVVDNEPSRGVISLPTPVSIVSGSKYGFSVVAAMVSLKFAFHQPTYRQQDWFAQSGWTPRRSTINDMMNWAAAAIGPLYQQMATELRRENLLLCDETTVPLLGRNFLNAEQLDQLTQRQNRKRRGLQDDQVEINQGGAVTSYAWLMMGPLATAPFNVFHWSLTRRQAVTDDLLGDFRGTVVADAYDAYVTLAQRSQGRIDHASCNAHARREFEKAKRYEPQLCAEAESFYIQLYAMEDRAKRLTPAERLALRQSEAIPIWQRMEKWLQRPDIIRAALPRSPFGKAVNYLQNQRMSLQRYLFNGDCPIDNNQAEQTIRPLTVGRRNWLFLGHPAAAPGRMQLLSIVSSAHRHDLIIEDYLQDVLKKLADAQQNHPHDVERDAPYLRVSWRPNGTTDWRLKRYQLIPHPRLRSDGWLSSVKADPREPHGESTGDGQVLCNQQLTLRRVF